MFVALLQWVHQKDRRDNSSRTPGVPGMVSFTTVWALCRRMFAFFVFCYADVSEVRVRANPTVCLTFAFGYMVTKTVVFAAACRLWVMFLESAEDA